jgi:hypothetical protein
MDSSPGLKAGIRDFRKNISPGKPLTYGKYSFPGETVSGLNADF